jgi:hypothetical protein
LSEPNSSSVPPSSSAPDETIMVDESVVYGGRLGKLTLTSKGLIFEYKKRRLQRHVEASIIISRANIQSVTVEGRFNKRLLLTVKDPAQASPWQASFFTGNAARWQEQLVKAAAERGGISRAGKPVKLGRMGWKGKLVVAAVTIVVLAIVVIWMIYMLGFSFLITGYVDVNRHFSAPPAPIGMADYGVQNYQGMISAYQLYIRSVTGTSEIYNLSCQGASDPTDDRISLQLNAVLVVNTTSGVKLYWLQNVEEFATLGQHVSAPYLYFVSNVWNFTSGESHLSNEVVGEGTIQSMGGVYGDYYVASSKQTYYYSLPLKSNLTLAVGEPQQGINVGGTGDNYGVQVFFSAQIILNGNGKTGSFTYDTVTIGDSSPILNAYIIVNGATMATPFVFPHYYDVEYVFAGYASGATVNVQNMLASMDLSYTLTNGQASHPHALYEFGSDTLEEAANIRSGFNQDGIWQVSIGQADMHKCTYIGS